MTKAPKTIDTTAAPTPPTPEVQTQPGALVDFKEPVSAADQTAIVHEDRAVVSELQMHKLREAAENEDLARDFTQQVMAARQSQVEKVPEPSPIAPRIVEQTNAEMTAGRACVAAAEAHFHRHGKPVRPDAEEKGTVAVFRPGDYIPDQKKGQGNIQATTINK